MTGVTKCMLRMQEKQAATRSRIEDLNFEEKTKNKLVWDQKTVEYINKLRGEGTLALYHLGMLAVCQGLGVGFQTEKAERLFHMVGKASLDNLGKFFQKDANKVVDVIKHVRQQTEYEAPKHRLQYEESQSQLTDKEMEDSQRYIRDLTERALNFLTTLAQSEKEMRKVN